MRIVAVDEVPDRALFHIARESVLQLAISEVARIEAVMAGLCEDDEAETASAALELGAYLAVMERNL